MRAVSGSEAWRRGARVLGFVLGVLVLASPAHTQADAPEAGLRRLLTEYCVDCHEGSEAEARVDLAAMADAPEFGRGFKNWETVVRVLRERRMPPKGAPQPTDAERGQITRAVDAGLRQFIERHNGDPGPVAVRRLTSAEYTYTIRDLTGVDLKVADDFVSDAVSGEGFTNAGDAQFMQDSTLERYLQAARVVADHAVIGSGPLTFFADPGTTGRELWAIARVQAIYREHGFRTAAGEGAEPFGLDLYPRAFLVAWRYRYRNELGLAAATLPELARREGVSARLCEAVWAVLRRADTPFPLSEVVAAWRALPPPGASGEADARARCKRLGEVLRNWQSTLAGNVGDEEEAAVLSTAEIRVGPRRRITARVRPPEGARVAKFDLSISRASSDTVDSAVVHWRSPRVQFGRGERFGPPRPLKDALTPESAQALEFGKHPRGGAVRKDDLVTLGEVTRPVAVRVPEGMESVQFLAEVALDDGSRSEIVRCRVVTGASPGDVAVRGKDGSALLADPSNPRLAAWREGVREFARLLPEVSHREPAPSDRDPIPAPYDNAYNKPERNLFHSRIKYQRDDAFFVEHVADDATRRQLDQAWTDLLTAFDYHDANLKFAAGKYAFDLQGKTIRDLEREWIDRLPPAPRPFVRRLKDEYDAMQAALREAEPGHLDDALRFAERAWRRPLSPAERQRLRDFSTRLRTGGLDHEPATRALLARVLVAPAFLYRVEPPPAGSYGIVPLSSWQLASRLSFFLWSSIPDEELRAAAAAGRLEDPAELGRQARRMLRDPKARRLAAEFFGQWLGFYQFDRYQGIDRDRFPEFTDGLRSALYEEAVSFFEHIVRENRPVDEVLFADYTFLNRRLAEHYGIPPGPKAGDGFVRFDGLKDRHRGGLLSLGAVLAATSAPRRTSAVKRGDWVLRRVVGTPVPPPPANVGSIPADDVLSDGLTVRQRLEAHRQNASCVNCHSRIDPLGFALEPYDPLGRWRETYGDGRPVDVSGTLRDGTTVSGPDGLRDYLRRERPQFHRNLSTKLLGYALGRAELASDRPTIEEMAADLAREGRFADLVVRVVTSRQFRNQRADSHADAPPGPSGASR
ncbi:MAG: DUF1592 domain-containing protein [Isosphaeraceae bacterium]